MSKVVTTRAIAIQRRFFAALDDAIQSGQCAGLKTFCDAHGLNRARYSRVKNGIENPDALYKTIDIDSLSWLCDDFGISPEWLLLGRGKMKL